MSRLLKPFFLSLNYKCNWENIAEFNKIICIFWSRSFNSFPLVRRKTNKCGKWIIRTAKQASGRVTWCI